MVDEGGVWFGGEGGVAVYKVRSISLDLGNHRTLREFVIILLGRDCKLGELQML